MFLRLIFIFRLGTYLVYFLLDEKVKIVINLERVVNFEENLPVNTMMFLKKLPSVRTFE